MNPQDYHRLLQRQIRKYLPQDMVPGQGYLEFIQAVNESYHLYESNRELVERAMRLSSDELFEKNRQLLEESERQKLLISALKAAVRDLSPNDEISDDEDLLRLSVILREAIEQRKRMEEDLKKARHVAELSLEARKLFLANISHEIRTPINAISGMADILAESDLSDTQREYLEAIRSSTEGLMVIINDVLDMSKLESGKFSLEFIAFNLQGLIQPLMRSMSLRADEKGIALLLEQHPGVDDYLKGDPTRINQVLTNLLSNAIKFTTSGSVRLIISLVSENNQSQQIRFEVADTGVGIESDKLHVIFDQFVQEDASITRRFGGTGLGLSISRTLVEMMGGKLEVNSEKDKGSVFHFTISLQKSSAPEPGFLSVYENKDLRGLSVLVVEDNELNRFLAITILKRWNAEVRVAHNGLEAIEFLKQEIPDIVMMDIQMPEMDGLQATEVIRKEMQLSVPILALTANAMDNERAICLEKGMNDYLSKPYKPDHLYERIIALTGEPGDADLDLSAETLFSLDRLRDMYGGNKGHIRKTAEIFVAQMERDVQQIEERLRSKDFIAVKNLAHRMKPNLELFGINSLQDVISLIEAHAEARNYDALQRKVERLSQIVGEVNTRLRVELKGT